jgi:hypothetical protein
MIVFKSCPRCRGDLHVSIDNELSCLQCGYELRVEEKRQVLSRQIERRRPVATA